MIHGPDPLIAEVRANGGSIDWQAARYARKCLKRYHAPMTQLEPTPFGKWGAQRLS